MAIVPRRIDSDIRLAPLSDAKLRPVRTGAVGEAFGEGLQKAGTAVASFAEEKDKLDAAMDSASARTLDVEAMNRLNAIRTEYSATRGLNAGVARPDTEKRLADLREELLGKATTPRMKNMLMDVLDQRIATAHDAVAEHARVQITAAEDTASLAREFASGEAAVGAASEEERRRNLDTGLSEIALRGQRMGLDPKTVGVDQRKFASGIHTSIISNMVDSDNVDAAVVYRNANAAAFTVADDEAIDRMLKDPLQRRESNGDADHFMGAATRDGGSAEGAGTVAFTDPLRGTGKPPVAGGTYGAARTYAGKPGSHKGLDSPAPLGSPIYSGRGVGTVLSVTPASAGNDGGNIVTVDNGGGVITKYMHLGRVNVKKGDPVSADTVLGTVGMTGRSTGPHLHYEMWVNGASVDPAKPPQGLAGGSKQGPERYDLNQLLGQVDRAADSATWSPERRERAKDEVIRRVQRDEGLQARAEESALREAYDKIDALHGNKLTSMTQLPASVRARLSPSARMQLEGDVTRNNQPAEVPPNGDTIADLHRLREEHPEQFATTDLRAYKARMDAAEWDELNASQGRMKHQPRGQEWNAQKEIMEASRLALAVAGIRTGDSREARADAPKVRQFQMAMRSWAENERQRLGHFPDSRALTIQADRMLITGTWSDDTGEHSGFGFQAPRAADGTGRMLMVDVPSDIKRRILAAHPDFSEQEVRRTYIAGKGINW